MTDTWQVPEQPLTPDDVVVAKAAAPYTSVWTDSEREDRRFRVADHLSDVDKAALLEFAKNVI